MTDVNDSHSSHFTSSANPRKTESSGRRFPEVGDYDIDFWADIWNVTPRTVTDWVKKYEIPVWGPSDKSIMISAEDMRSAFQKRTI